MDSVSLDTIQKLIAELLKQVQTAQQRAAAKHLHSLDPQEWITAQRAIGAERALDDLSRRIRSLLGLRPEWVERHDPIHEIDLHPRIQPGRETSMLGISNVKKRRIA